MFIVRPLAPAVSVHDACDGFSHARCAHTNKLTYQQLEESIKNDGALVQSDTGEK